MDLTAMKPDQISFVESQSGLPHGGLAELSGLEVQQLVAARQEWVEFWNAAQDFITTVLLTDEIDKSEDWLRLELVRLVHLLDAATVRDALSGSDEVLERHSSEQQDSVTLLLILRYLTATRSAVSATEECRLQWWGYPSTPPKACQRLFREIIDSLRQRGPVPG